MSAPVAGTAASRSDALVRPSLPSRVMGLGSVFGKALRDSRRTAIALGVLYAIIVLATAGQILGEFNTPEKRQVMAAQLTSLPAVFQGMLGTPIGIEHLGGFLSWRVLNFVPVLYGIWAVVALGGTLSGELARGSMDMVAATALVRRRVAVEKAAAYLVALAATVTIIGIATYAAGTALASLPGDAVSADAVAGHMAWLFLMILVPGAVAFAAAPFLGRGGGVGLGAITLFGSFVIGSYASTVPVFETIKGVSYFQLTDGHRPLAGVSDWGSVGILAAVTAALLVFGVEAFARRDLLVPGGSRIRMPRMWVWVRGPFTRGLGERLPAALAWGAVLGLYGLVIASSSDEFVRTMANIPEIVRIVQQLFPNADILSTAGFLQLAFYQEAIIIIGLATAAFVGGWASDESDRRLEVVLGAPIGRVAWTLRSAAGVMGAIVVSIAVLDLAVVIGVSLQGDPAGQIAVGVAVLGLYGMALAGIGLAVGGLIRPSLAGPVTLAVGLGFYLLDVIGQILKLPDAVLDIALNRHLGQPIVGDFDWPGMALCAAVALGGVALCAIGMQRRDLGR